MKVHTVLAVLAVPVLLATPATGSGASAAGSLTELDASFTLADNGSFETYTERIKALSGKIDTVTADDVFGEANREAVAPGTGDCPADLGVADASWFCWDSGDGGTEDWYPQGVSGSWDARSGGGEPTKPGIMVSWYDHADAGKGTRISLIDNSDPDNVRYRHALLVEPTNNDTFKSVDPLHAGGVAWVGDYLYVVDTNRGIRVFDLTNIWRTEADSSKSKIGEVDGGYYAFDYRFAIPQVGAYTQGEDCVRPAEQPTTDPLCYSSVSVDHSTDPSSLLTGEFYYDKVPGSRMARWSIDSSNGKLVTDDKGKATSKNIYQTTRDSVQGSASDNETFWLNSSAGSNGELHTTSLGEEGETIKVPSGPEDFSFDPSSGTLWSLSEHTKMRSVYGVAVK